MNNNSTVSSIPAHNFFQVDPEFGRNFGPHKPKGWTTIRGYWRESSKLSQLIDLNRQVQGKPYTWAVAINIEHALTVEEIKRAWEHVCRVLRRQGVVALWVREPSPSNHVNYHLMLSSEHTERGLHKTIRASMPGGIEYHAQVKPIRKQWAYARYITKAKVKGYVGGVFTPDKYRDKRLLFVKKSGLSKHGTIGSFWSRPKSDLWSAIVAREQRISDGLRSPDVRAMVEWTHQHVFHGEVSRQQIERSFGFHGAGSEQAATLYSYRQITTQTAEPTHSTAEKGTEPTHPSAEKGTGTAEPDKFDAIEKAKMNKFDAQGRAELTDLTQKTASNITNLMLKVAKANHVRRSEKAALQDSQDSQPLKSPVCALLIALGSLQRRAAVPIRPLGSQAFPKRSEGQ